MAREGAGTLVLVGRGGASSDAEEALERIRATRARVEVRRADITDTEAIRCLLDDIRAELSPVRGIVHAAMVLDDAPLDQLDRERLKRVMAPKLAGAWNLHTLTLGDPLECFVLFSSIASLLGNPLQANYAAANAFFEPLAHHRRALGLPALSVDWGVLAGVGYLAQRQEVAEHLARQGYLAFDTDQALGVLGELLRRDVGQVMAARMDWRTWARSSPTAATAPHLLDLALAQEHASGTGATASRETLLARLNAVGLEERRDLVATFLRERVARILGTAPSKLDLEAAMADLGFDSLMAVELTTVLSMELGVELGVVKLLQGVSLQGLAELILEELKLPEPAAGAAAPPTVSVGTATASPPVVPANASLPPATRQSREPQAQVGNPIEGSARGLITEASARGRVTPNGNGAAEYASLDYSRWTGRQRVARLGFGLAWRVLTNLHVEGLDNLPAEGAFLVAANHVSMVDAPLVMTALPRRTIVFAGERLRESPFFNWFLSDLANAIYIRRGAGDMEALQRGLAVLRAGGVLAVGPEGGISQTGALQHGHTGVAYLATQTDVPVVPVAAWGQERLTQQWRRLRRPPVHLRIGSPIRFPAGEPDGLHLRSYTDQIMQAVADLLPPEYRGVYGSDAS